MNAAAVLAGATVLGVSEIPRWLVLLAVLVMVESLAAGALVVLFLCRRELADSGEGLPSWLTDDDRPDWSESELHRLSPHHAWEYGDANGKRVLR